MVKDPFAPVLLGPTIRCRDFTSTACPFFSARRKAANRVLHPACGLRDLRDCGALRPVQRVQLVALQVQQVALSRLRHVSVMLLS